ncbi:hypothetical protein BGZ49_007920 [Haplosporangium sp. Z 27]|nr:hypothetical protein BGZ49_007920 [Haplosporangium sp. Z 27]
MDLGSNTLPKETSHLDQDHSRDLKQLYHHLSTRLHEEYLSTITNATIMTRYEPNQQQQDGVSIKGEEQDVQYDAPAIIKDKVVYSTVRALAKDTGMLLDSTDSAISAVQKNEPSNMSLISAWTKDDLEFAKALWDYWYEIDVLNRIHAQLERELENELGRSYTHPTTSEDSHADHAIAQINISGPIVRFPLSAPMPAMPNQWVALIQCIPENMVEIENTVFQLETSAIIFYPAKGTECKEAPVVRGNSIPVMTLSQEDADRLISKIDSLSHGALPMCSISGVKLGLKTGYGTWKDGASSTVDPVNIDNIKSSKSNTMGATSYSSDSAYKISNGGRVQNYRTTDDKQDHATVPTEVISSHPQTNPTAVTPREEMGDLKDSPATLQFLWNQLKARAWTLPNLLTQRSHSSLPSQILDEIQYLITTMEKACHSDILCKFWSNNFIRQYYNKYSSGESNASFAAKVVVILMSTICTVVACMFGGLLFLVSLKLGLFQSQRSNRHSSHSRPVTRQLVSLQQQPREKKKVVPKQVLESFGYQTVLHNSSTAVTLTTTKANTKFTNGKIPYAKDVNEMEEGLESSHSRVENRRQRRRRTRRTSNGLSHDSCDCEENEGGDDEKDGIHGDGEEREERDVEQIAAAAISTSRPDLHHRITYNRQGQVNQSPLSSSRKDKKCCSSHSHERKKKGEKPFANVSAQTMCAICLSEYEVGEKVRSLSCFHQFHQGCIDPWLLDVSALCPICKRDLWPGSPEKV